MSEEEVPEQLPPNGNDSGEPSSDKSIMEYTVEAGEAMKATLGELEVFLDRELATSKLNPTQLANMNFKMGLAIEYLRAGLVHEAKYQLAQVGYTLQLAKSENGFFITMMRTQRQEIMPIARPQSEQAKQGFFQRLWKGGKKQQ